MILANAPTLDHLIKPKAAKNTIINNMVITNPPQPSLLLLLIRIDYSGFSLSIIVILLKNLKKKLSDLLYLLILQL